ncbi:LysR family transcriptional regulator [Bacillus sp. UNC41MFS5]|uniref:LysR family transcriptional regulator n=1 Tax=Bacillus sp. UNC41MFS5 TaxID=1449046 RepID=UPI000478F694|nr:LysR family transcriptional regulator [Bacillus sp. UNC41MFS5]
MDFRDFTILEVLFEEKNIKKAADRLYLSQPAITYRIQQLEKELDIVILIRGNKGVQFTLQGEYLVESAKSLLLQRSKVIEKVQNMGSEVQGTLRLGVSNNFAIYKLPPILASFNKAFPKVKIQLKTGLGKEIMKLLEDGEIHIGIESAGHKWDDQKVLIDRNNICLISKEKLSLEDLPTQNFIYIATPSIKRVFGTWWQKQFAHPPMIMMETDYVETCKKMVISGLGVGFVPSFCLQPDDPVHILNLPADNGEEIVLESWMNYRNSSLELSVVREFVNFIGLEVS